MRFLSTLLALLPFSYANPIQSLDFTPYGITPRANSNLAGYLGAFFLGSQPSIYFYLSNGNTATSLRALNRAAPVIVPTLGTKGVRDPSIVEGGGSDAGKKWYIIGTDLDIGRTNWEAAQRHGSRAIFVWESTDLVNWTGERLVTVEDATAGMVWAPAAIWDAQRGAYLVHWASRFFAARDPNHTGTPSPTVIRYAYTKDFKTFESPKEYINMSPTNVIDLDFLPLGGSSYARFLKDETKKTVYTEISTSGLFGKWTRPGGPDAIIAGGVEGPAVFWDNVVEGKAHMLLDHYAADGYRPYESTNVNSGNWTASSREAWPRNLRHGSVLPITAAQMTALGNRYP